MSDEELTTPDAAALLTHLENLIQQLEERHLEDAIALIETLLDHDDESAVDGPAVTLVPLQRRPRELDD